MLCEGCGDCLYRFVLESDSGKAALVKDKDCGLGVFLMHSKNYDKKINDALIFCLLKESVY